MGSICCSSQPDTDAAIDQSIGKYMSSAAKSTKNDVKMLLLGTGSAGKSTLFKSLRSIHSGGIDHSDLMSVCPMTRANCVKAIQILFNQSKILHSRYENESIEKFKDCFINTDDSTIKDHISRINSCDVGNFFTVEKINWDEMKQLADSIEFLWNLDGIQATYRNRGNNFAFEDNLDYFFNKCHTIFDKNYIPTEQDYKKTKVRTIGMTEYSYVRDSDKSRQFRIIDVGGQRSDRRKWIYHFEQLSILGRFF